MFYAVLHDFFELSLFKSIKIFKKYFFELTTNCAEKISSRERERHINSYTNLLCALKTGRGIRCFSVSDMNRTNEYKA